MSAVDPRLSMAIQANVDWYERICALHGVRTRSEGGVWSAVDRPPALHSDVQIIGPGVPLERVLERIGDRRPAGLKDCFGAVDASPAGMTPLFSAEWIHRPAGRGLRGGGWHRVVGPAELRVWNAGWDTAGVLLPEVLEVPGLWVVAEGDGHEVSAGAVISVERGVAYLSHVHAAGGRPVDWDALVATVARVAPGSPVVGYERGDELAAAVRAGFDVVGTLTVWVR